MKRKPTQIVAYHPVSAANPTTKFVILYDDGTLWEHTRSMLFDGWRAQQIELPPAPDTEAKP
jgi:hypothetical protein